MVARTLGSTGFGQYNFIMIWIQSQTPLAEFGLATVLNRDLAAEPEKTHLYLVNSLVGKTLLAFPSLVALTLFATTIAPDQNPIIVNGLRWSLLLFGSGLVYNSLSAIFKAHQVMTPILWTTIIGQIISLVGIIIFVVGQYPLYFLIAWAGASQSFKCLLAFRYYNKLKASKPLLKSASADINFAFIKKLMIKAWPFALSSFLRALQFKVSLLLLAYLKDDQALGWYGAASRFVEVVNQLFGAFYTAMLPALTAIVNDREPNVKQQSAQILVWSRLGLLILGTLIAIGVIFLAKFILILIYRPEYAPATLTLQILFLTLIPSSQNHLSFIHLYAHYDDHFANIFTGLGNHDHIYGFFSIGANLGAGGYGPVFIIGRNCLILFFKNRVNMITRS